MLSIARALYVGQATDTHVHAHHAVQICVALDVPFRLRGQDDEPWRKYEAAIVPSNVPHQLDGRSGHHALLYVEPESVDGRKISAVAPARIEELPSSIVRNVRRAVQRSVTCKHELFRAVFQELDLVPLSNSALDNRIGGVIGELRANPNRYGSIPALAKSAGLSPSRFRHLFTAEMGVNCRQYLLWVRLYNAVRELAGGASVTEAAHASGFSDAAYLTRTFRRMFGIVPSAISGSIHLIEDEPI